MTTTAVRHPLRERAFTRLWSAGFLSEVGQWMLLLVLPLYVLQLTGSALITSTVAMLGLLPSLVAGPFAGGIVVFLAAAGLARAIPSGTDPDRSPERLGFWQGLGQGLTTIWRTSILPRACSPGGWATRDCSPPPCSYSA